MYASVPRTPLMELMSKPNSPPPGQSCQYVGENGRSWKEHTNGGEGADCIDVVECVAHDGDDGVDNRGARGELQRRREEEEEKAQAGGRVYVDFMKVRPARD